MHNDSDASPKAKTWPPPPVIPPTRQTVLVPSQKMLGLLTNAFLWDFLLGLVLGVGVPFALWAVFGALAGWAVPRLPMPRSEQWFDWAAPTLGAAALFMTLVRRYTYLMIGFATTALILSTFSLFLVVCFS